MALLKGGQHGRDSQKEMVPEQNDVGERDCSGGAWLSECFRVGSCSGDSSLCARCGKHDPSMDHERGIGVSITTIRLLLTVAINALKLVRWYYSQLSPEQQTEIKDALAAWKKQIADMPMPEPPSLEGR